MDITKPLNSISDAIEEIAKYVKDKAKKSSDSVLDTTNVVNRINDIKEGIKNIKKDTEEILKNQKNLIEISKEKNNKSSLFESAAGRVSKIKDGVNLILLIAGGVLAIGTAFKLVGEVDFKSVLALGIALPLVAMAFDKIAQLKGLKSADIKSLLLTTLAISTAVTVSSWILKFIAPISLSQAATGILVAGMFYALSTNIAKLIYATKNIENKDIVNMGKVLLALTSTITLSSWILRLSLPVSLSQAATAILITGIFYGISLEILNLRKGTKDITIDEMKRISGVLLAMTGTITAASWLMKLMIPIGFGQAATGILITGLFYGISLEIANIRKNVKDITNEEILNISKVLLAMTGTITMASWVLNLTLPISIAQAATSILVTALFYGISLELNNIRIATKDITLQEIGKMSGVLLAMTGTIVMASWILRGTAEIEPSQALSILGVTLFMALTAYTFGPAIKFLSKIGTKELITGGLALLGLAVVISASSWILSVGNYDKYPTLEWAAGVGLSLVAFGLSAIVLGAIASTGIGTTLLLAGGAAVLVLAGVIVATSYILAAGTYGNYPKFEWAQGVGLSLTAFGIGAMVIGTMILSTFGLGAAALVAGAGGIVIIAKSIVDSSNVLKTGDYTGGPTKEWAEGISSALTAFSPIFEHLNGKGLLSIFSSGPSPEDFSNAIITISNGIVTAGKYFSTVGDIWKGGPTAEWATGVGGALAAFTPIFESLSKSSGLFGSGPTPEEMNAAMLATAKSMVEVATVLGNGTFRGSIPDGYMSSMSDNIRQYVELVEYLQEKNIGALSFLDTFSITSGLSQISNGYDKLSKSIKSLGNSLESIDIEKLSGLKSLTGNIILLSLMDSDQFEKMMDSIEDKSGVYVKLMEELDERTGKETFGTIGSLKQSQGAQTDTQILSALQSIDSKMDKVISNGNTLSELMAQFRQKNNNNIKDKKHL